jgi:tRNA A-37 threonylcarbamoyl transferase component Bud32
MRLERAARTVAALHAAGFLYPDLLARHLRVGADGEMRLIDAERMRGPGVRSPLRRAVDLGTFLGTLPRLAVPERDRLRWFRAATRDLDRVTRRTLARRVLSTVAKTRDRTRHRHGAVELHPRSRHVLIAGVPGALSFETWFDGEVGERLRRLPDRENRRLEVDGRTFFLKRHFDGSRAAIDELDGTLAFRRAGLPAVIPAAVGEDVDRGSFWLAEQAEGEPLDDLLARGEEAVPFHARRELARILGRHAARLRRAGRFHRDFYLNHWIGCWSEDNGWTLSLIDLQRAGRNWLRTERWHVKDAAQLWYSARRTPLTRTDGLRFVRACFGIPRLDGRARTFVRRVLRRVKRMAARKPRTPVSGDTR